MDDDRARELLAAERTDAQRLIASLSSDIVDLSEAREGDNSDDEHDPEGSTLAFERSQASTLLTESRNRLEEIAEAESRIEAGTFGICTNCGKPIAEARLEARPYAALCVNCASKR
jgi:DnaK suppressor protein